MTNEAATVFCSRARWTSIVGCALALLSSQVAHGGVWTSHGPRGGIVRSLAADPTSPSTVYAGTSSGGVFKTTNGGAAWTSSSTGIQPAGDFVITGIAVDPATPSRVFATAQSGPDGGIFRSTNGGASWTYDPIGWSSAIAFNPTAPATLYSTGADVRKSVDGGATWTTVLAGSQSGGSYAVAIDPVTPSTVYVGMQGWVAKTTDAGAHWTSLFAGLPGGGQPVAALAIDPATPTTLYAGTQFGVFKSVDAGLNWADAGLGVLITNALAIDPSDPDVVYAGGLGMDAVTVYKSVDGGANWTPTPVEEGVNAFALLSATTLLAAGNDAGMFKTTDAAATWAESNTGLVATAVLSVATDPGQPGHAYAGTWNKVHRTADGGALWTPTTPFFTQGVASVAIDGETPGTAYAGDFATHGVYKTVDDGETWFSMTTNNQSPINAWSLQILPASENHVFAAGPLVGVRVTSGGQTAWTTLNNGLFPSVLALVLTPSNPGIMYAGTEPFDGAFQGVFKTTDAGASWSPVNTGLPVGTLGVAVVGLAMDRTNHSVLYAAVEDTGIFKTTNAGGSWALASNGLGSLDVTAVAVDAIVAHRVYASTLDQGVFMSDDGGGTWTAVNDGLVTLAIRTLAVEPGRVYAGTGSNGVFVMDVDVTTTTSTSTSTSTTSTTLAAALLGRALTVRDPIPGPSGDPSKRKIVVTAREANADETLNPFALVESGGSLTLETFGATPSSQTFRLSPPLWTLLGTTGARYTDKLGVNGPVKSVVVKKSAAGTFQLKATILGKLGPGPQPHVVVVPPNPGVGAKMVFQVNGADSYCTGFGGAAGGQVTNQGAVSFKVSRPTAAVCP